MKQRLTQFATFCADVLLWTCVLAGFLWAFGAIWFLEYLPGWVARPLALAFLVSGIGLFFKQSAVFRWLGREPQSKQMKFNWKKWARPILAASVPCVYIATLFVGPSNDRIWAEEQKLLPEIRIDNQTVTISNFRDFQYQSSGEPMQRYQEFSFDLSQLDSAWFLVQRFMRFNGMAHTFVSFGLDTPKGKKYFSISVEIRREADERYSPIAGIFRNYELMYVVGSEQDLVGVRTNVREKDRVYLYRVNATRQQVQELFKKFASRVETLRETPEFYSTFLNNCTNNIVAQTRDLTPEPINPFSPRIILPGYSAQVAWKLGLIGDAGQTFDALQKQSRIDEKARSAGISDSFSDDIRN